MGQRGDYFLASLQVLEWELTGIDWSRRPHWGKVFSSGGSGVRVHDLSWTFDWVCLWNNAGIFDLAQAQILGSWGGSSLLVLGGSALAGFVSTSRYILTLHDCVALYGNYFNSLVEHHVSQVVEAEALSLVNLAVETLAGVCYDWDLGLRLLELLFVFYAIFFVLKPALSLLPGRALYEDFTAFCIEQNLAVGEVLVFSLSVLGALFLDFILIFEDEFFFDASHQGVLLLILGSLGCLFFAVDVHLCFLLSNAIGEPFWRTYLFDLINIALCLLRIFTCWFRYIFYDLQLEYIDTVFFFCEAYHEAQFQLGGGFLNRAPGLRSVPEFLLGTFLWVSLEGALMGVQIFIGLIKIAIATYLLWLILDLFLLRPLAYSEATAKWSSRTQRANIAWVRQAQW